MNQLIISLQNFFLTADHNALIYYSTNPPTKESQRNFISIHIQFTICMNIRRITLRAGWVSGVYNEILSPNCAAHALIPIWYPFSNHSRLSAPRVSRTYIRAYDRATARSLVPPWNNQRLAYNPLSGEASKGDVRASALSLSLSLFLSRSRAVPRTNVLTVMRSLLVRFRRSPLYLHALIIRV